MTDPKENTTRDYLTAEKQNLNYLPRVYTNYGNDDVNISMNLKTSIFKFLTVCLLVFVCLTSQAQESEFPCPDDSVDTYFGYYRVDDVVEYAKGTSDLDELNKLIGIEIILKPDLFVYGEIELDKPYYNLECYPGSKIDSEVSPYRWSTYFNGFGFHERSEIKTLHVFKKDENDEFINYARLEIISDTQLWEGLNFWFLKFNKLKDTHRMGSDSN